MLGRFPIVSIASFTAVSMAVFSAACGGSEASPSSTAQGSTAAAGDGIGSTLGGCPQNEPADGDGCTVQGRMCHWKRSCGARATGWCTASAKWRVVAGPCSPCPETPTTFHEPRNDAQDAGPVAPAAPQCEPALACAYPSTPLAGSVECTCNAQGAWPSLCASRNDGWTSAPSSGSSSSSCVELDACGGRSGCGTTCSATISPGPNGTSSSPAGQTTKSCGCGEDGLMYCAISLCGG